MSNNVYIDGMVGIEAEYVDTNRDDLDTVKSCLETEMVSDRRIVCEALTMFDQPYYDMNVWYIMEDSSICEDFGAGIEIVSPPMNAFSARVPIQQVMKFIREHGITDESCGFHFTISAPGIETINPLELLFLMDEDELAEQWSRNNNEYACGHMEVLASAIRTNLFFHSSFENFLSEGAKVLPYHKRCTVNLEKWMDKGLLEFRVIGGPHYEHQEDAVIETIDQCLTAVDACIEGSRREEFLAKARAFYDKHVEEKHPHARYIELRSR